MLQSAKANIHGCSCLARCVFLHPTSHCDALICCCMTDPCTSRLGLSWVTSWLLILTSTAPKAAECPPRENALWICWTATFGWRSRCATKCWFGPSDTYLLYVLVPFTLLCAWSHTTEVMQDRWKNISCHRRMTFFRARKSTVVNPGTNCTRTRDLLKAYGICI